MRAAPKPGRRIPVALAVLLFLLLTATSSAIAGEATPQAIPDPGGNSAGSAPTMNTPRIVEFVTVPPAHCDAAGVVRGTVGIEHAGSQPVQVQLSLTAIERATGREIVVDEHALPAAGSVEFSLEGDFSGELTGFVARVRLLDASNTTLQSRFNPIDLPCAEPDEIVTLPVTGAGSGTPRPIAVGLVALAATIVLGIGGIAIARIRPGR